MISLSWAASVPKLLPSVAPFGAQTRIQGQNNALVSVISPMVTPIRSPAVAVNVQTSRSPLRISPLCVAPLVSGPPSSPDETVIGPVVWVIVSRSVPPPLRVELPLAPRTTHVPYATLFRSLSCAAAVPKLLPSVAPFGAQTRIQGQKRPLASAISPMVTPIRSPAV